MDNIDFITFSELLDKLMIINIKLYHVLEKCAELDKKTIKTDNDKNEIVQLNSDNIRLVKQRSTLKNAIDKKLNLAITQGKTDILDEVKKY
jgi:hypothetical protein